MWYSIGSIVLNYTYNVTTFALLYVGSKHLPLDRRQQVFHNGTFVISKVNRKDAGEYSCTAANRQGTVATQKGHINVIGKSIIDPKVTDRKAIQTYSRMNVLL